ncbi:multidrug effflux MFS transporter [Solwaraspora sp. WMMD1047]|uniref:multidrug effflux MFS transporter n=1 Tax=Solwaraspora sp. WMMD1047 TaxID=3016102 RepID=UPI002417A16A|nr:multidrug effflux MFS transporter [Solwaraspora sp. WMMD1047]MDG4830344.1 multidrug effflux MFS transporter [Solwaraspora sp. WMMD1047]
MPYTPGRGAPDLAPSAAGRTVDRAPGQPPSRPASAPEGRRAALTLLVLLGSLTAIGPLSLDMYLPAFPEMTVEFGATETRIQLSLTSCLVGIALGQFVTGPLSDRWGRRTPVLLGLAGYAVFSLLCAFAPSPETLTGLRLAQGFTGGMGVVVARAVVRDRYAGTAAAKYFSRLTLVFGVAPIAAPAFGSLVLRFASWRGVFVALTVIGVGLAAAAAWRLPETLPRTRRSRGGLAATAATMRTVLADPGFVGYALTQGLAFAGLFAYISGSSFVFQEVFDVPDGTYSLIFGLNAVGLIALGQLNARLLDRFPPRTLLTATLVAGLLAAAALIGAALIGSLVLFAVALFGYVATIGMVMPNGTALALEAHAGRAGTAAALLGAFQSMIGALAAPLVGLGGSGNALPMAVVVCGCAAASLLGALTLTRRRVAT